MTNEIRETLTIDDVVNKVHSGEIKVTEEFIKENITVGLYQRLTDCTALYPKDNQLNYVYPVLGLIGEISEILEIVDEFKQNDIDYLSEVTHDELDLIKELGDGWWYVAQTATALNLKLTELLQEMTEAETEEHDAHEVQFVLSIVRDDTCHPADSREVYNIGKICNRLKKMACIRGDYKNGIPDDFVPLIKNWLIRSMSFLFHVADYYNINTNTALCYNILKLFSRKDKGTIMGDGHREDDSFGKDIKD